MYAPDNFAHPPHPCAQITRAELEASARLFSPDYVFAGEVPAADQAVLRGHFNSASLRPGLMLHAARVCDLCDARTHNPLRDPGIKILLLIDGATDIAFGSRRVQLTANQGVLLNLAEPDMFSRRWQRGRHEGKVSLTLTRAWLEESGLGTRAASTALMRFTHRHLACQPWPISARAHWLAQCLLAPGASQAGLHRLQLESHCLELAALALGALEDGGAPAALSLAERRRLARLEEVLHDEHAVRLNMADIARAVASNPTSLQALARRAWGMSVFERMRAIRLEQARALLVRGGAVADAAELAGYSAASNFATAFRRRYGMSPSRVRLQDVRTR